MLENTNKASLFTFKTKYWYDEAGNRIRKQVMRYDPEGGIEEGDGSGSWVLDRDEFYVRDLSGKEIAIYYGSTLQQWNIYGLDQIGHMKADLSKFFYLKDHLGSTRAVIDTFNQVVSAQDYDPWGFLMENRTYETGISKYKFTGKERDRDIESNYDYFGARYYDSRIGNWTSIDPLFEKHFDYSPYNYVLRSPMVLIDPDGKQIDYQMSNLPTMESGGIDVLPIHQDLSDFQKLSPQPGILEPEAIDPVDVVTGVALAKISFKLTSKFVFKEGAEITGKTLTKEVVTESTEQSIKFSSRKVEDAYNKVIEFLGENVGPGIPTRKGGEFGDVLFTSPTNKIRFDLKYFKPHGKPHVDVEKLIENEWKNVGKIFFKQ